MRNKYIALCLGITWQALSVPGAKAIGPLPLPSHFYQTNPAFKMTPQQKTAVGQAFSWAQQMFNRNHTYLCKNRRDCLSLDLKALATFINSRPTHPARTIFQDIYNTIRQDSHRQKFVTQWVVFSNLSLERQQEYSKGIRVTPIQPLNARLPSGALTPAHFNQDDVFTDLLQTVDHSHKNCEGYISCLSADLQIIKHLHNRLAPTDPVRTSLKNLSQIINTMATQKIFNTDIYLKLYNPLSASWNDTLTKHKAKKITAYGYKEWQKVKKSSRAVSWRAPRITNGLLPPKARR